MTEQWRELKETITEMRDNGGTGTQQDVCKFLANYMETLEKQMQQPMRDATEEERKSVKDYVESISKPTGFNFYEAQPCEDCISREEVLDVINFEDKWLFDAKSYNADTKIAFSAIKSKISELPSVTPQASEEDIHREREQAYMLGYEDASKKFRTEPCEDAVNREAVLELAKKGILVSNDNYKCVVNAIKSLPPVTLQRPKGKWITQAYSMRITCTNCEKEIWYSGRNDYKYCPNCGAYMGGAND